MTQIVTKTQPPAKRNGRIDPIAFFERFGVLIFMFLLLIFFQTQNSNFLSERNIFNILTEVSIYGNDVRHPDCRNRSVCRLHSGGMRHDGSIRD